MSPVNTKRPQKKKRKKHGKSILQPKEDKRCFLCMLLHDDYREKIVHEHHVMYGKNHQISEELGLKVNLCPDHHQYGPEAVHRNHEIDKLLKDIAQRRFEELYSHEEWWKKFNQNFYTEDSIWDIYKKNMG